MIVLVNDLKRHALSAGCVSQLRPPSSCWWRIRSWWTRARRCLWSASRPEESRLRAWPGPAAPDLCRRRAWWRKGFWRSQPSPPRTPASTAASPATTWGTRPRSPPPSSYEVCSALHFIWPSVCSQGIIHITNDSFGTRSVCVTESCTSLMIHLGLVLFVSLNHAHH